MPFPWHVPYWFVPFDDRSPRDTEYEFAPATASQLMLIVDSALVIVRGCVSPGFRSFGSFGSQSHASPAPSPSESAWFALATVGQLSQRSPTPSPSESSCALLKTLGQLSTFPHTPS